MKKKYWVCFLIIIVFLGILSVFAFYTIPLVKANSLLISANKSDVINELDDNDFISQENYEKLRIVNKVISENEYVQLKTAKKLKFYNFKNIDLNCSVKATIDTFEENISPKVYNKKITISFSFNDCKWIVSNVKIFD